MQFAKIGIEIGIDVIPACQNFYFIQLEVSYTYSGVAHCVAYGRILVNSANIETPAGFSAREIPRGSCPFYIWYFFHLLGKSVFPINECRIPVCKLGWLYD